MGKDQPYLNREIDEKFTDIKDSLIRIESQTTRTNGRVGKLERWQSYVLGFCACLCRTTLSLVRTGGRTLIPCFQPVAPSRKVGTGRDTQLSLKIMAYRAVIKSLRDGGANNQEIDYSVYDTSTNGLVGSNTVDVAVNAATSGAEIQSLIITALTADALTNLSVSIALEDVLFLGSSWPRVFINPSLAVNTARQASSIRDAFVSATVDITASLSLTTGQKGTVALQYADDSSFTMNVKTAQSSTNGNTGSLTIGLNLGQVVSAAVSGIIPAGKYYRLATTQNTGTPTFGTPAIQEVLL